MSYKGERMGIRDIVELGDPLLRSAASPVADPSAPWIGQLVADLQETLAHWRRTTTYGRGIAAPQIGEPWRIVFLNVEEPWPLINPTIVARSEETETLWDACLSFLTIFFQVDRHRWIDISYQDLGGNEHRFRAEGGLSELLQHEIDHVDGIVAIDRITDPKTICTRAEFEARYRAESPYAPC